MRGKKKALFYYFNSCIDIACVQTPLPLSKNRFVLRGGGVCTQAGIDITVCVADSLNP